MVFLLDDITLIFILPKILVMLVVGDQHDDQRVNKVWHLKKRIFFKNTCLCTVVSGTLHCDMM